MKNVHIVPHMHWDREWYFTAEASRILLVNNMAEILDRLETDPDYPYYVLDGQTAILEDYFAVVPHAHERVKALVQAGKLIIGPWYTQTDTMMVGGESIVRNLLYGIQDCQAFGDHMAIGYLPDSFGQSGQLPEILAGFGIECSLFWRGLSDRHTTDTEFWWTSDTGSRVLVQNLPLGYAIGKYLPTDAAALKKRMDTNFAALDKGATTAHILLPNGHDQMPLQQDIFAVMNQLRILYPERDFFLSRYEHVFDELKKVPLKTLKGEFLDGRYMRVHRSIFSTRSDIKSANTRIENKLTNHLEPLASLAYSLGFDYHHGLIEHLWKTILKNHAHDSIGCCCSDPVHREIFSRFQLAENKADALISFYQRRIADAIDLPAGQDWLVATNLLPYERTETITAQVVTKLTNFQLLTPEGTTIPYHIMAKEETDPGLIDRQIVHYGDYAPFFTYHLSFTDTLPPMGYQTYVITPEVGNREPQGIPRTARTLETTAYHITIHPNGTLTLLDKDTGTSYPHVLLMENMADDGDEYDYSPLPNETPLLSQGVSAQIHLVEHAHSYALDIRYPFAVPKNLASRKAQLRDGQIHIHLQLTIPKVGKTLELHCHIDNQAQDHRLRLLVPTPITATHSLSDNQFGTIRRPVTDSAMAVWEAESWDERPDSIYPMLSFVSISDDIASAAVLTNSVREFQVIHTGDGEAHNTLAVTLFRSVGTLGKENLVRRPGRPSGIKLSTPDSQMPGHQTYACALVFGTGDTSQLTQTAKTYLTPLLTYNKTQYNAMKLNPAPLITPTRYSLLRENHHTAVLSVLKKSEHTHRLVARFYNPTGQATTLSLQTANPQATQVNLNEAPLANLDLTQPLKLQVNQVVSVMLDPK